MILTKAVKSTAFTHLKGKWMWAIAVAFIPLLSFSAVYLVQSVLLLVLGNISYVISFLLDVFISCVVLLGALRVFWHSTNNCYESFSEVFYYFSEFKLYKKAITFLIYLFAPILLIAFLLFLPSGFFFLISSGKIFEWFNISVPAFGIGLNNFSYFLLIIGWVLLILRALSFYLSAFLFVSNEELTPAECVREAYKISKYVKGMYTTHIFGYILYILLSIFVLPLIFTAPFLIVSYSVDCRFCISYYNRLGQSQASNPIYRC